MLSCQHIQKDFIAFQLDIPETTIQKVLQMKLRLDALKVQIFYEIKQTDRYKNSLIYKFGVQYI
jgi:DNA-binding transcriptional regulator LsrR (DeoR family)